MLPEGFREGRSIRIANTIAMGASLATLTGDFFALMEHGSGDFEWVATTTISTFMVGALWAVVLRSKKRVTRWKIQKGWLLSIPLAALNAALSAGALFVNERDPSSALIRIALGMALGATYGSIVWVPALFVTLMLFGLPIARAQRLAEQGLAGEENGERIVGITSTALGALGTLGAVLNTHASFASQILLVALGLLACASGVLAAVRATARASRRNAFVANAEAGRVEGYRVETVPQGKVLIRVETGNEAYRAGERFEAVFELSPDGAAKRALVKE